MRLKTAEKPVKYSDNATQITGCTVIKTSNILEGFERAGYLPSDNSLTVKLFIQYDLSAAAVMHELGYPKNRHTLYAWYKEYKETEHLHRRRTQRKNF
ncbi:MAG: hypothetical protein ACOYBC_09395 [Bilifractor sp.]|jgi:hypothetical protein